MKLDPIFKVENNSLFYIDGGVSANFTSPVECFLKDFLSDSFSVFFPGKFLLLSINQSEIELGDDLYAEDTLAALREKLLLCDEADRYIVFAPHTEKSLTESANLESFINTFNHTARRVKDCKSVAGFDLSDLLKRTNGSESALNQFTEILAKKHAQYVYFAQSEIVRDMEISLAKTKLVCYSFNN